MQYKNIDPSGDWSKLELLNYQDILEDVLTSNYLLFNFEDPDVQKNFSIICDFMLHRFIPQIYQATFKSFLLLERRMVSTDIQPLQNVLIISSSASVIKTLMISKILIVIFLDMTVLKIYKFLQLQHSACKYIQKESFR